MRKKIVEKLIFAFTFFFLIGLCNSQLSYAADDSDWKKYKTVIGSYGHIDNFEIANIQGATIIVSSNGAQELRIWRYDEDRKTKNFLRTISLKTPTNIFSVSEIEQSVAVSRANYFEVYNLENGELQQTSPSSGEGNLLFLKYINNQKEILTFNASGKITIWDAQTLKEIRSRKTVLNRGAGAFSGRSEGRTFQLSPDETIFSHLDIYGKLTLISVDTLVEFNQIKLPLRGTNSHSYAFTADSQKVVLCTNYSGGATRLWVFDNLSKLGLEEQRFALDESQYLPEGRGDAEVSQILDQPDDSQTFFIHNETGIYIADLSTSSSVHISSCSVQNVHTFDPNTFWISSNGSICSGTALPSEKWNFIDDGVKHSQIFSSEVINGNHALIFQQTQISKLNLKSGMLDDILVLGDEYWLLYPETHISEDKRVAYGLYSVESPDGTRQSRIVGIDVEKFEIENEFTLDAEPETGLHLAISNQEQYLAYSSNKKALSIYHFDDTERRDVELPSNTEINDIVTVGNNVFLLLASKEFGQNVSVARVNAKTLIVEIIADFYNDEGLPGSDSFSTFLHLTNDDQTPRVIGLEPSNSTLVASSFDEEAKNWVREPLIQLGSQDRFFSHNYLGMNALVILEKFGGPKGSIERSFSAFDLDTNEKLPLFEPCMQKVSRIPGSGNLVICIKPTSVKILDTKYLEPVAETVIDGEGNWVTVVPDGFFVSSAQSRGLVSVVSGYETVDIDRLYDSLHAPNEVRGKLEESNNLATFSARSKIDVGGILNFGKAPEVKIVTPSNGTSINSEYVDIEIAVKDLGGGIGDVLVKTNSSSKSYFLHEGMKNPSGNYIISKVPLSLAENEILVTANNSNNNFSSAVQKLTLNVPDSFQRGLPDLYIVSIAVTTYADHDHNLAFPVADQTALLNLFKSRSPSKLGYRRVVPIAFKNSEVTFVNLKNEFQKLKSQIRPHDVFILHVAGHGESKSSNYYFLPYNYSDTGNPSIEFLNNNAIHQRKWIDLLTGIDASRSLLLFDTCEAGTLTNVLKRSNIKSSQKSFRNEIIRHAGRTLITASGPKDIALEGYKGHGVLSWAIFESLAKSNPTNGIDTKEIINHVKNVMPVITRELTEKHVDYRDRGPYEQKPEWVTSGDAFKVVDRNIVYSKIQNYVPPIPGLYLSLVDLPIFSTATDPSTNGRVLKRLHAITKVQIVGSRVLVARTLGDGRKEEIGYVENRLLERVQWE